MKIQKDVLGVMACMALMGAVGSFFLICTIAGVDVEAIGFAVSTGLVFGFGGMFFSLLLLMQILHK